MLKRILAGVLALAMALSFAACSEKKESRSKKDKETTATTDQWNSEVVIATTAPHETEEPTVETTEPATESGFAIGTNSGNTYKSEFIGIQCTLDANWVLMTDEEIRAQNEATLGMLGDEYEKLLANAVNAYDMMATNVNEMDTVAILLEKLSGVNALLTEVQYIEASKDMAVAGLEQMGFTIEAADVITVQFAGAEHAALSITGNYLGVPVYECVVAVKCGEYVACVTACTWLENTCMDVLNLFQPI